MRRITATFLIAALLVSLTACEAANQEPTEAYVSSADIEVAIAFVENGTAKVVTRKTSDKELTSIDLCCVYFLSNGEQVGDASTIQCDFTKEGGLSVWSFAAPSESEYMECVVSGVIYADGIKQTCSGVSAWADQTAKAFSVEKYKEKMKELSENQAVAAKECDAVEIFPGKPAEGKLKLGVKNTSGKEISEVVAYLLWFDANGVPVDMQGALVPNSEKVSAKTLAIDEEASYTVTAPEGAAVAKGVVQSVIFADGTVWENDYVYEWAVSNYVSAK